MEYINTKEIMNFIDNSPTMFHAISNLVDLSKKLGFIELKHDEDWQLEKSKGYYIVNNDSSIIVFKVGEDFRFNIIGSHCDSPTFKLKPNFEILSKEGFITVNTEPYGSPIFSSWFDRPLSVAGRVVYKSNEKIKTDLVNIDENLLIIPNLAIHMNRDVNNGYKYNAQKDLLPLFGTIDDTINKDNYILSKVSEKLSTNIEDILDFDLFLYDRQKGNFVGKDNEFFSVGKIDNLGMAYLSTKAVLNSVPKGINISCVFDNEEVGSGSINGALGTYLADTLKRITIALKKSEVDYYKALSKSFIISADQAHSFHPNYNEAYDITNHPIMNKGVTIKYAANQSYTTNSVSAGYFKSICDEVGANVQSFVNRSDKRGGSTIGPLTARRLNIKSIDIGAPILSMHSVRELGGSKDSEDIYKIFMNYYSK